MGAPDISLEWHRRPEPVTPVSDDWDPPEPTETGFGFTVQRPDRRAIEVRKNGATEPLHGHNVWAEGLWAVYLPHQCDDWEIAEGTRDEALTEVRRFRDELDQAIRILEAVTDDEATD